MQMSYDISISVRVTGNNTDSVHFMGSKRALLHGLYTVSLMFVKRMMFVKPQ